MYTNNKFLTHLSFLQDLRVLVVDNNVEFCDSIALLLQPHGVEVQKAFSVEQALDIFGQSQPDILVSGITLLNENGYASIQQLRTKAAERGEVVIAIAVTGYANENILERAVCDGFDLWFDKPLDFDEFLAVLGCLALFQQSSYALVHQILDCVPKHGDLHLENR